MKNNYIFFLSLLISLNTYSQVGYLGRLNTLEFQLNTTPVYAHTKEINSNGLLILNKRFFNTSHSVIFGRVISKKNQVIVGYRHTNVKLRNIKMVDTKKVLSYTTYYYGGFLPVKNGFTAEQNQITLGFRHFVHGMAPFGKYLQVNLDIGKAQIEEKSTFYIGPFGKKLSSNFYKSVYLPFDNNIYSDSLTITNNKGMSSFIVKGKMGSVLPIANRFAFSYGFSFSLISFYKTDNFLSIGYSLLYFNNIYVYKPEKAKNFERYYGSSLVNYNDYNIHFGLTMFL